MARIQVSELKEGDSVSQVFLVRDYQFSTTKKGQPFARLRLGDASGIIAGIYWDIPQEAAELLRRLKYVTVTGAVRTYQDSPQVNVDSVAAAELGAEEALEFLPQTDEDVEALFARLREIMGSIEEPQLARFVGAILADAQLVAKFKGAPAAMQMHHAYIGGLLEHTVSMAEAAVKLCEHYGELNRDLLLTGVLIHDIGKIEEFDYETAIDYSDSGRLVGHIAIGISIIEDKAAALEDFPKTLLDILKHYVLSHHGVPEFGAIRQPMTAEAVALHHIDNLDAKLAAFFKAAGEPAAQGANWTAWQKMFESYLYTGDPFAGGGQGGKEEGDETGLHKGANGAGLF